MYGGSGYISSFDNSNNWEVSFDVKFSGTSCGAYIIKSDETSRDKNELMLITSSFNAYVNGSRSYQAGYNLSVNNWYTVKICKQGTSITCEANNVSKTISWSLATSLSTLSIGVDSWGATAHIKNIIVKPL